MHLIKNPLQKRVSIIIQVITFISLFLSRRHQFFINSINLFFKETGYITMEFDVIFPMHLSEFTKTLNFGSNLKKTWKKNIEKIIFSPKN